MFADDYVKLLYVDTICRNVDRHSGTFGVLRDPDTGEAIRLAPNYDNNIAMFARLSGMASVSASKDMLITDFIDLLEQKNIAFEVPKLSKAELAEIVEKILVKDATGMAAEFVFSRQNMIAGELVKIRARARGIETSPAAKIIEAEKQIDKLNRKIQSTSSIQEKTGFGPAGAV